MSDEVRQKLDRLVKERGESYAALSQLLGRNAAYIQQFVKRGLPRRLAEEDRKTLARYFGVDEALLGGEPGAVPEGGSSMVRVPSLSVQASAGPGSMVEGEFATGTFWFDQTWLSQITAAKSGELSIVTVAGDSMVPTLNDRDEVLVSHLARGARPRDGIHVLRRDDVLIIKRLTLAPNAETLTISSDNPAYPAFRDCPLDSVAVLGRVIWIGRKLG